VEGVEEGACEKEEGGTEDDLEGNVAGSIPLSMSFLHIASSASARKVATSLRSSPNALCTFQ
jgi:hypothetical protein